MSRNNRPQSTEPSTSNRPASTPRRSYIAPRVEKRHFVGRVTLFSGGGASGGGSVGTSP